MGDGISDGLDDLTTQDVHTMQAAGEGMNYLATICGNVATDKGFRDDWHIADRLEHIALFLERSDVGHTVFRTTSDDQQVTVADELRRAAEQMRINVIGMKLMLTVSELGEALESLRNTGWQGMKEGLGNFDEEIADAHIRLLDLGHMLRVRIGSVLTAKVKKNRGRPRMHGRKV